MRTRSVASNLSALVIAAGLSACGMSSTPSPSPISPAAAEATALAQYGRGPNITVVSTRLSTYGAEAGGGAVAAATKRVWVVTLSGIVMTACGTPPPKSQPCSTDVTSAEVLIDADSGAFLQAAEPARSP